MSKQNNASRLKQTTQTRSSICKSNTSRISVSAAIPRLASTNKYSSSTFHGQLFRKVRRSSARILFRMSYFLRKEIRGRIKRKRRMVQKERKWLSRITWSLTTYYGTLFRKRRGPARWLKKQFAALRRVLSGKFHAYESRFESRLDYWLYKLHFTRRLSHSIILLKAGHIRLNGVTEKRFDHILRPLDVITFSPKVSRWYRRCFHGTTRQVYSRQLRHPRKKLNVAFYLNSRRFVQQRKTFNTFTRNRLRQSEFVASRYVQPRRSSRFRRRRSFGQASRMAAIRRQQLTNFRGLPTTYNQFCQSSVWSKRTPRLQRVVSAFRTLSRNIRRALRQRNIALASTKRKALLPFYQLQQLNRALLPLRSFRSNLDKEDKRPLDYFLLNEFNEIHVQPSVYNIASHKFLMTFITATPSERIRLLQKHFPGCLNANTTVTAAQLQRIQLLCIAVTKLSSAEAPLMRKRLYSQIRQVLSQGPQSKPLRCLRQKQAKRSSAKKRQQKLACRRKEVALLPPEQRRRYKQLLRVRRKAMRKLAQRYTYPLHLSHRPKALKQFCVNAKRRQCLAQLSRRSSKAILRLGTLNSLLTPGKNYSKTLATQAVLLQAAARFMPIDRLTKRLASYKANKTQSDTAVHQLTQVSLAHRVNSRPNGRSGLRTFIMTFTSRGKILKGRPRSSSTDYSQRRSLQLLQRVARPTIAQAARVLSARVSTQSKLEVHHRQDLYRVFSYMRENTKTLELSRALQVTFFQSRAQQQPCWKTLNTYFHALKTPSSRVPTPRKLPTLKSCPTVQLRTHGRTFKPQLTSRQLNHLLYKTRKPWNFPSRLGGSVPRISQKVVRRTLPHLDNILKSYNTKNTVAELNQRFAAIYWERNLPHYKRINHPLRYKTAAYKRHKQRQQLTASFRNRVSRWGNRKKYKHSSVLNSFHPQFRRAPNYSTKKYSLVDSMATRFSLATAKMARFYPQDFLEWAERRRTRLAVKTEYNPLQYNPEYLLVAYYHHLHGNLLRHRRLAHTIVSPSQFVSAYLADATLALQTLHARMSHNGAGGSLGSTFYQLAALAVPLTTPLVVGHFDAETSQSVSIPSANVQSTRNTRAGAQLPISFNLVKPKSRLRTIFQPNSCVQVQAVRWLPTPQARHRFRSTDQWPTPIPYYRWTWQTKRVRPGKTFHYMSYFSRYATGLTKYFRPRRTPTSPLLQVASFAPANSYSLPQFDISSAPTSLLATTQCFAASVQSTLQLMTTPCLLSLLGSTYSMLVLRSQQLSQVNSVMLPTATCPLSSTFIYKAPSQTFHWATVRTLVASESNNTSIYNFAHLKLFAGLLLHVAQPAGVKQHRRVRRVLRRQLSRARRFGYRSRQQMRNSVVSFYYARKRFSFINRMHVLAPRAHVANEVHLPTYAHVVTWRRSENTPTGTRRHGTALTKQRIYAFIRRFKHLM